MNSYLMLMYYGEGLWETAPEAERSEIIERHTTFPEKVERLGCSLRDGNALHTSAGATTLREVDGRRGFTDGPFAETAEQLGGYYLVDAPDLATVRTLAEELPSGYAIEIRQVDENT